MTVQRGLNSTESRTDRLEVPHVDRKPNRCRRILSTQPKPREIAEAFIATWNIRDSDQRLALLRGICAEDATFASPGGELHGCSQMNASISEFTRAFPNAHVSVGKTDGYRGHLRFTWLTVFGDGRPDLSGDDYADLDASGKITKVVSFDGHTTTPTDDVRRVE